MLTLQTQILWNFEVKIGIAILYYKTQNFVPGISRIHDLLLGSLQNKRKSWLLYQVFELFPSGVNELPFWEGTGFPSWVCEIQRVPEGAY